MFSSACLLASLAILFYVLKYRVHVHVTYTPSSRRKGEARKGVPAVTRSGDPSLSGRRAEASLRQKSLQPTAMTRPVHPESVVWGDQETTPILDIQSALVNLGAKPKRAKAAAEHVLRNWPDADFSTQLRAALQEVAA
jgi:hypothetical protein